MKSFILQCGRVWKLLRKPTTEEWKNISKISILGLGLIGLLGFTITIILKFIYPK